MHQPPKCTAFSSYVSPPLRTPLALTLPPSPSVIVPGYAQPPCRQDKAFKCILSDTESVYPDRLGTNMEAKLKKEEVASALAASGVDPCCKGLSFLGCRHRNECS
jgi:hypothetical protein